ncbi:MAG: M28 family peptidase [Bacteroidota bacterium]|nr:M28 family peptidase [Bacteroidota bacterium]
MRILLTLILYIGIQVTALSQAVWQGDSLRMKKDLYYLASDKLNGRLTGTKYERKAGDYIIKQYKQAGLTSLSKNFRQEFKFYSKYELSKKSHILGGGISSNMSILADAYPIIYSSNGRIVGNLSNSQKTDDERIVKYTLTNTKSKSTSKVYVINLQDNPHETAKKTWRDYYKTLSKESSLVSLVIFYGSDKDLSLKAFSQFTSIDRTEMPMIMVSESTASEIEKGNYSIDINIDLKREKITASNIVGYIDNSADKTIIIGAHYDHLGEDEYHNSLYRGPAEIHNGADDNASGTVSLIEIARNIKLYGSKSVNYLFIAFSGEELGLYGSNYYVNHPLINNNKLLAMLNMDMAGRLKPDRELGIYGTGTSIIWDSLLSFTNPYNFNIKKSASGIGASDHTSFYLSDIPVLHFFTGFHQDYHKPSDDAEKINYPGMNDVAAFVYFISQQIAINKSVPFAKTKEELKQTPRFKVTLGIVPDYFWDNAGIRIDGISPGKAAEKAGLLKGDVIMKLGDNAVGDMQLYMEALGKFNPGDKTTVNIIRGTETLVVPIQL